MDYETAWDQGKAGLDIFVRDLALCLSVHRDRGPALVWPDGVDAVLAQVPGVPADREPEGWPPGPRT